MGGTIIIFTLLFTIFYVVMKRRSINNTVDNMSAKLSNLELRIDSHLKAAEVVIDNAAWMFGEDETDEGKMLQILRQRLINNKELTSSCIAFEPNHIRGKGRYYMLIAERVGDQILLRTSGSASDDYHGKDWYLIPLRLKKSRWSEPYNSDGTRMCTYSHPLIDKSGHVFGVLSANISLEQFSTIIAKLQPLKESYSFLISRYGYYITHKDKERILNETIFSNGYDTNDTVKLATGRMMISGKSGYRSFMTEGRNCYAFFCPISSTGWSVCTVCPESVILSDLNRTSFYLILLFILSITVLFGSMFFISKKFISELKTTTASNERIQSELNIAKSIQMGMIPKIFPPFPDRSDIDLYAYLRPAKEVGGDLYDFFIINNILFFTVGDVSGKGVPASLLMAVTRSLFRNIGSQGVPPKEIVESINTTIAESNEANMFVTLFVGQLYLETGKFIFCNAGHNPPVIFNATDAKVEYMTVKKNIPVGLLEDFSYEEETHLLKRGDSIVLYTDGVTEAEDKEKTLFGDDALVKSVRQNITLDAKQIAEIIYEDVVRHADGADQSDDITVMTMEYHPEHNDVYKKSLLMTNDMAEIERMNSYIENICHDVGTDSDTMNEIRTAIEEALTNTIRYAYPMGTTGKIGISTSYDEQDKQLTFLLSDGGAPFDPTKDTDGDHRTSGNPRPAGIKGIAMLWKTMDIVTYRYHDEKNELTFTKKIKISG
jgi:sigma-B regulation protein RsbU (phosphoserine phosphatase)